MTVFSTIRHMVPLIRQAVSLSAKFPPNSCAVTKRYSTLSRTLCTLKNDIPVASDRPSCLLLAKMKDADLAPLEAAAEDAGVDPAHYYTTHTLCDAFLAKCDQARMQSFAPLFEGSADAARAALAALLPNTFLQALVWRTLTTPEAELLPEVTEHESV